MHARETPIDAVWVARPDGPGRRMPDRRVGKSASVRRGPVPRLTAPRRPFQDWAWDPGRRNIADRSTMTIGRSPGTCQRPARPIVVPVHACPPSDGPALALRRTRTFRSLSRRLLPVRRPSAARSPSERRPSAVPRRAAGRHGRAPTACHGTRGRDASGATRHKPVQAGGRPVARRATRSDARRAARGDAAQRSARAPHRPGLLTVPDPSPVRKPGRFPPAVGPGRRNRVPHRRGEPARRPLIRGSPAAGSRGPRPSADSAR